MTRYHTPFEVHVHSQIPLRPEVGLAEIEDALRPLFHYTGAKTLRDGGKSLYEEEPGILFNPSEQVLQLCWTVNADDDFRQTLDEFCMAMNELSSEGVPVEVSVYDSEFDDEDENVEPAEADEAESRDDFYVLFIGPTPQAIMKVQRDLLVQDIVAVMERHFDATELGGIVAEIDRLFSNRFDALHQSLDIGKIARGGNVGGGGSHSSGGRRPRHLH